MKKPTLTWKFLHKKRSDNAIEKRSKEKKTPPNNREKYCSPIIDYWANTCMLTSDHDRSRFDIRIPKIFSIMDAPADTLNVISKLAAAARTGKKIHKVTFDHSRMSNHDLAAETLLGLIAKEFERESLSRNRKLKISGQFPRNENLVREIRAIGLIKDLDVKHEQLHKEQEGKLQIFTMCNKNVAAKVTSGAAKYNEIAAKRFVDHVNKCLENINKELTPDAVDLLAVYAGEILANADEHGGLGNWNIRGYFDGAQDQRICEIVVFNFGKTIAETFLALAPDSYAFQAILPYIEKHMEQGFFTPNWSKESLITLAALQGDISSKNKDKNTDRGQGTVEMIEFFQKIHKECSTEGSPSAKMAILSGNTHILFDGKYAMCKAPDGRKVIAFNHENSLFSPPDSSYVRTIGPRKFPGTIISIKFSLEKTQMQDVSEAI